MEQALLAAVFAVPAIVYLALIHRRPFRGEALLKCLPILFASLYSFFYLPAAYAVYMGTALLFSALGDVVLTRSSDRAFVGGLASFLVAHLIYVVCFRIGFDPELLPWTIVIPIAALCLGMAAVLYPRLGALRLPVYLYLAVILAMVITASAWSGPQRNWLLLGAIVFMFSDAMIAVNRFLRPLSWSQYFIMTTYYSGQLLMVLALSTE